MKENYVLVLMGRLHSTLLNISGLETLVLRRSLDHHTVTALEHFQCCCIPF